MGGGLEPGRLAQIKKDTAKRMAIWLHVAGNRFVSIFSMAIPLNPGDTVILRQACNFIITKFVIATYRFGGILFTDSHA